MAKASNDEIMGPIFANLLKSDTAYARVYEVAAAYAKSPLGLRGVAENLESLLPRESTPEQRFEVFSAYEEAAGNGDIVALRWINRNFSDDAYAGFIIRSNGNPDKECDAPDHGAIPQCHLSKFVGVMPASSDSDMCETIDSLGFPFAHEIGGGVFIGYVENGVTSVCGFSVDHGEIPFEMVMLGEEDCQSNAFLYFDGRGHVDISSKAWPAGVGNWLMKGVSISDNPRGTIGLTMSFLGDDECAEGIKGDIRKAWESAHAPDLSAIDLRCDLPVPKTVVDASRTYDEKVSAGIQLMRKREILAAKWHHAVRTFILRYKFEDLSQWVEFSSLTIDEYVQIHDLDDARVSGEFDSFFCRMRLRLSSADLNGG